MDGLSVAASIIAVIQMASTVTQYLATVKGASKERQKILSEITSVTGMLYLLMDQADDAENDDSWNATLHSLIIPNGPLEQFKGALETLASKLEPVDGWKKLGKPLMWPFQEKEIKDILGTIERQKTLFILAQQNDHIALTKAIKKDVIYIQNGVEDIGKGIFQMQFSGRQEKLIRWLSAPDPSVNYNNALKARHAGSGRWLMENSVFMRWVSNAGVLLWLHGIPGCGKTILSCTAIQHIFSHCQHKPASVILYYYFSFNAAEKQRPENMIRSLVTQLFIRKPDRCGALETLFNHGYQPTSEELLKTFHLMMGNCEEVFVILDALDECTERPELLADIEEMMRWKDIDLHLLATSRRESDIEDSLDPLCDEMKVCIQSAVVNDDIRSYVHDKLYQDRRFKRWSKHPNVRTEIENDLMEKAGGMFRWAACQLDSLSSCLNLPQLRKALQSLPRDLDGTYERILCNIDDAHRAYALKVLQWLTFSVRPLCLEELAEVIVVDTEETPRVDLERRLAEPRDILTICSSLISLNDDVDELTFSDDDTDPRSDTGTRPKDDKLETQSTYSTEMRVTRVTLAHFSVKEYLVSERIREGKARGYSIQEIDSNAVIAEDCLAYLLQFDKTDYFVPPELDRVRQAVSSEDGRNFPLAVYAATYWAIHARTAERSDTAKTLSLSLELLLGKGARLDNWIRLFDYAENSHRPLHWPYHRPLDWPYPNSEIDLSMIMRSPIHFASFAGLVVSTILLLKQGYKADAKINIRSGELDSLRLASIGGYSSIVGILLDNGADINFLGGRFDSALYQASLNGHEAVVYHLLEKGADVNKQGGFLAYALQAASFRGSTEIVQLLIENSADVNAQGGYYGTALQVASLDDSTEIVQLLIENGADVNTQGGYYGNALQAASFRGLTKTVQLLIENGADVKTQGGRYGNALHAASARGLTEIVRLLIENGADINTQGGMYGNALQAAFDNGNIDCARLLIEMGADVNIQGGYYGNPLQTACYKGQGDIVRLLIEEGADVNAQGDKWGNALSAAFWRSRIERKIWVQYLLDNGAVWADNERFQWAKAVSPKMTPKHS